MRIHLYGSEELTKVCERVKVFDTDLAELAIDMGKTMYGAGGIGIAAPQVGESQRIIVVDCSKDQDDIKYLINPEIVATKGYTNSDEGCLSFPGLVLPVRRHKEIEVKAQNLQGEEIRIEADGLLSICIQHEIDHLDGILFVDHLSPLKRKMAIQKIKKSKKNMRNNE